MTVCRMLGRTNKMDEVEQIKNKIDIVELIGQYLTLKKAGANYKALCPFHTEKSPSFMVSPDKQIYKCFGCNEGGDIFNFVMKMENLEFVEALELLADKAGVELPRKKSRPQYQAEKDKKTQLYQINNLSAKVFSKILMEHKSADIARKYLKRRQINNETMKQFNLGYAPQKKVLRQFLADRGFSEREIQEAGSPDKFFKRIIFPINDIQGNPVGFTGRTLDDKIQPKYLNTPETTIFHKSHILYGLDKAKTHIKQKNESIIVEGQMDVISSYQAGVKNVVASSGTALTADHLKILLRYGPNISFSFDQDEAGTMAAKRAIELAISTGFNVKVVVLPAEFKDAGEIIEKDAKLWPKLIKESVNAIDWYFDQAFAGRKKFSGKEKKEIAKKLLPLIKIIPDKVEQEHYIKALSKKINTPEKIIREALQRVTRRQIKEKISDYDTKQKSNDPITPEENLVGLLLIYPEHLSLVMTKVDYLDFPVDSLTAKIYKFLESCYTKSDCDTKDNKCLTSEKIFQYLSKKLSIDEVKKVKFLLLEIETMSEKATKEEIISDIRQSLSRIKQTKKDRIKIDFAHKISLAEEAGDRAQVKKLLEELQYAIKQKEQKKN